MSLTKKYGCGCDDNTIVFNKTGVQGCCNTVQAPPSPCCESHSTTYLTSICFRPTCSVVATADPFFIAFSNICNEDLPISSFLKFLHQGAGFLNIINRNGDTFEVSLMNPDREGAVIEKDDCIVVTTIPENSLSSIIGSRCLSGQFVAPALDAEANIVIINGTGIPIGSTLTFTWEGDTGSYLVTDFISASGTLYAYKVKNTGSGHVPGTIIDGGTSGSCDVPIEIVTEIDLCDLSATQVADSIAACVGGSPRGLVSEGLDSVISGDGTGKWVQKKFTGFDCCIFTDGVTKFVGLNCVEAEDTVLIQETTGTDCFNEAWLAAQAANTSLMANIEGVPVIIVSWDNGTNTLTLRPIESDYLGEDEILEFEEGSQICLGECCAQCTNGPQTSNQIDSGERGVENAYINIAGSAAFNATGGAALGYLIGYDTVGAGQTVALTATYNDDVIDTIGKPTHSDPLLFRQKICNTSPQGCDQRVCLQLDFELAVTGIPAGLRAHFEIGAYALPSETLEDGATVNPFTGDTLNSILSQNTLSDYMDGPCLAGNLDTTTITGTSIGFGGPGNVKSFPWKAASFPIWFPVKKCDCANVIVWFYLRLEPIAAGVIAGTALYNIGVRRIITRYSTNDQPLPDNDYDLEGFA